ncbi:unnamed protein product [Arabidopsis thaliana]|nr:unnamed protein product [Arabidopsis thaliana]
MSKRLTSVRLAVLENDDASSARDCKNLVVVRVRVLRAEASVALYPIDWQIWLTAILVREKENSAVDVGDWSEVSSNLSLELRRRRFIGGGEILRGSRKREGGELEFMNF